MVARVDRPLNATVLPMASALTLITALVHVAAGGESPTAAGVLLAVALTHGVWLTLTNPRWSARIGRSRAHYVAFGVIGSLQAITHHLFGFGAGSASIEAHHGHVVVDAGAHAAHGAHTFDLAMVAAHSAVTLLMLAMVAGCDGLLAKIVATCSQIRRRWRLLLSAPSAIRVEAPARLDRTAVFLFIHCWSVSRLSVRGPPLAV